MPILATALSMLISLSPTPPDPKICTAELVDGATLYCCPLSNGLKCCAETLAGNGTVSGCGCSP